MLRTEEIFTSEYDVAKRDYRTFENLSGQIVSEYGVDEEVTYWVEHSPPKVTEQTEFLAGNFYLIQQPVSNPNSTLSEWQRLSRDDMRRLLLHDAENVTDEIGTIFSDTLLRLPVRSGSVVSDGRARWKWYTWCAIGLALFYVLYRLFVIGRPPVIAWLIIFGTVWVLGKLTHVTLAWVLSFLKGNGRSVQTYRLRIFNNENGHVVVFTPLK